MPGEVEWTPERRAAWQRRWIASHIAGDRQQPIAPVRAARAGMAGRILRGIVRIFA